MSKKIKVIMIQSLSGSDGNYAAGDEYSCSRDEAIRHFLKGHCEAPGTGKTLKKFIDDAEAFQQETGFGLNPSEYEALKAEKAEAEETEAEKEDAEDVDAEAEVENPEAEK